MTTPLQVLEMIAKDAETDAHNLDGKPFDGKTVATQFGNHGASITALAKILARVIEDQDKLLAAARQQGFDEAMDQAGAKWGAEFRKRDMPLSAALIEKAVADYKAKRKAI